MKWTLLGLMVVGLGVVGCGDDDDGDSTQCASVGDRCAGVDRMTFASKGWNVDGATCSAVHYVSEGALGGDGSEGAPYGDLPDALAVASAGECIALAGGLYQGGTLPGGVSLLGAGAARTTVTGDATSVLLVDDGQNAHIRGIRLTGTPQGLEIRGARSLTVEQVLVEDVTNIGIFIHDTESTTLSQVRVTGVKAASAQYPGVGIYSVRGRGMVLDRVLVERSAGSGIQTLDGDLRVESSVVRDNDSYGIAASCRECVDFPQAAVPDVQLVGNRVERNGSIGIWLSRVNATVTDNLVTDTRRVLGVNCHSVEIVLCPAFQFDRNMVQGGEDLGVLLLHSSGSADDNLIQDQGGRGLWIQDLEDEAGDVTVALGHNLVMDNVSLGVGVKGLVDVTVVGGQITGHAKVELIIENQIAQIGDALQILDLPTVVVSNVLFEDNGRTSVLVDGPSYFRLEANTFAAGSDYDIVVQNLVDWDPTDSVPPTNVSLGAGSVVGFTEILQSEDYLPWDPTDIPESWDPTDLTP